MAKKHGDSPQGDGSYSDPLSDENVQAAIDALSTEDRDMLVLLAAQRLEGQGIPALLRDPRWIGACYDIMRSLIENDMRLAEAEE